MWGNGGVNNDVISFRKVDNQIWKINEYEEFWTHCILVIF